MRKIQTRLEALEKRKSDIEQEQDEIDSLAYQTLSKMDFLHFRYVLAKHHLTSAAVDAAPDMITIPCNSQYCDQ